MKCSAVTSTIRWVWPVLEHYSQPKFKVKCSAVTSTIRWVRPLLEHYSQPKFKMKCSAIRSTIRWVRPLLEHYSQPKFKMKCSPVTIGYVISLLEYCSRPKFKMKCSAATITVGWVGDVTLRTLFITAGTFLEYKWQCRCMEFQGGTCSVVRKQTDCKYRLPLESLIFQSDNLMVLNDFRIPRSFFSLLQVLH